MDMRRFLDLYIAETQEHLRVLSRTLLALESGDGEADTGTKAIERYRELKPDLVTMDIVMPDMGGIDAVRAIVKEDPGAKILMCSAMGQQALVIEAIQAGARDFVVKPFQPSRVLEAVQRVLG